MIKILDNFFEDKLFLNIKNHVTTKLCFTPRYVHNTKEKTHDNYYGSRFVLSENPELLKTFVTQSEKKFKIKIKKLHSDSGVDIRNLSNFTPHIDTDCKINILTMLAGPTAVTNGTVFYYTDKDNNKELDIHVGFRENRAILFDSTIIHTPNISADKIWRTTMTLFINKGSFE